MHSHNTWGISGPVFLTIFATASVACLVWALCDIYRARRIRLDDPIDRLTPTEIGMLVDDSTSPLPCYDTTDLHARALVERLAGVSAETVEWLVEGFATWVFCDATERSEFAFSEASRRKGGNPKKCGM